MDFQAFLGGSYESQSPLADCERTVNWYHERLQAPGATARYALYPTPGVVALSAAANGPGRAHFFMDSREFAVISTSLIEIDINGTQTVRGAVALDANPATISSNGDGGGELFVTSGGNGYTFDLATNTLTQVAALNGLATMGHHLDGYFLALNANTGTWYISALLDGTSWATGTDFAQRSIAPDPWRSQNVGGRYIWNFGEQTSEVWFNNGGSFPFAPYPSGLIPYGIAAPSSAAVAGSSMVWLSTSSAGGLRVVAASGFTPEVISSYAMQSAIEKYNVVSDAVADTYEEAGHMFYVLHFPRQDVTWCYDFETRLWHERGTWVPANSAYTALRPRWIVYAFGDHRALDSINGSVYRMAATLSTDVDGAGIRRLRRAPSLDSENERVFYNEIEVFVEPGLGLSTGQGSDPQIMMRFSDDGGKTWSSERWQSAGKIGEYDRRARWTRLGMGRRRVFEVAVSDPIPWRLVGASLDLAQQPASLSRQRQRSA